MSKVLKLQDFKDKKQHEEDLKRGRTPLYVSHKDNKIYGSPSMTPTEDFGDKAQRIRASLEKINRLMQELKKLSDNNKDTTCPR